MDRIGLRFDEIAATYDRVRPGYPAELFDDVASMTGLAPGARVLEVGCGSGQATRDLLARGWHVHAVEPGTALAALAEENLAGQPFTLDIARFDDWDPRGTTYDMLFSATAYHWVAPEIRWHKAAAVLAPGGVLALTTNRTVAGGEFHDLYRSSAEMHARFAPEVEFGLSPPADEILAKLHAADADIAAVWEATQSGSEAIRAGRLFTPPVIRSYEWETSYDTADAIALLTTYSPYMRVPPRRRELLFSGMADIIRTDFGGTVRRRYLTILAVARKREPRRDQG